MLPKAYVPKEHLAPNLLPLHAGCGAIYIMLQRL